MAKPQVFDYPRLNKQEHEAIKALWRGDATEYQQQLGLQVVVNKFSRAQDNLYIPGSFDESAFLNGRAFVGQAILKHLKMPIGNLEEVSEK